MDLFDKGQFFDQLLAFKMLLLPQDYSFFVALIISSIFFIYLFYRNKFNLIKKQFKLDGPTPLPIIGNLWPILTKSTILTDVVWREKYGKVFLLFAGLKPRVVVADPELLTKISTKDFEYFRNHYITDSFFDPFTRKYLVALPDMHWKLTRAMFSPTFTSSKIKHMYKLIDICANDLTDSIGEVIDKALSDKKNKYGNKAYMNCKEIFSMYTLDVVASCCFAMKLSRSKLNETGMVSLRNDMAKVVTETFEIDTLRAAILLILPEFFSKIMYKSNASHKVMSVAAKLKSIINDRRKKNLLFNDYLQILLDAKFGETMELNDNDEAENHHAGITIEELRANQEKLISDVKTAGTKVDLNEEDIIAESVFMLVSAGETPAVALRNIIYTLAYHPEVQEKLYKELVSIAKKENGRYVFTYEQLTKAVYLDAVVSEDMRYEAPAPHYDRVANDDYYVEGYDFMIPKGTPIYLSIYGIHRNPEYWPEPEKFDPERFMPENKDKIVPGTYVAFGQGPRHCLGVRFCLTEIKIALAKCILHYKFSPVPGFKWPSYPLYNGDLALYTTTDVLVERRPQE